MKCELCHQHDAETVLYRPQEDGRREELYVCKTCAERESVFGETHGIQVAAMGIDTPSPTHDDGEENTDIFDNIDMHLPTSEEMASAEPEELLKKIDELFGKIAGNLGDEHAPSTQDRCPRCGMTPDDIRSTGLLGCPNCLKVFRKTILRLLTELHGCTTYCGAPSVHFLKRELREQLTAKLKDAIAREDYAAAKAIKAELAALERDEESSDGK